MPVKPGCENLHVVRKFGTGQLPIVSCRRYFRATDSFEQVGPSTLDLDEE